MRRAAAVVALLIAGLSLARPLPVTAHPFGPFSISVASELTVLQDHIEVRWVLDMAETSAIATVDLIDADGNGRVTRAEKGEYFDLWVGSILGGITLVVDDQEMPLSIVDRQLALPEGEGGVLAVRLVMDLTAELPAGSAQHVATYRDTNYTDFYGWREVAVAAGPGIRLLASTVPTAGRTKELTEYPADLGLSVPTSEAEFTFATDEAGPAAHAEPAVSAQADEAAPGFSVWPNGILAAVLVIGFAALLIVINRPGDASAANRRRPRRG